MKKILGLDIGITSIGWAIVEAKDEKKVNKRTGETPQTDINNDRIGIYRDAVGVRKISAEEMQRRFNQGLKLNQGEKLTPTAKRRKAKGMRRMRSRYKLRRDKLRKVLEKLGMMPDAEYYTDTKGKRGKDNDIGKAIYELRDRSVREDKEISLQQWGRIMLHLNQWRGYSSDRFKKDDKPKFDYYIAEIIEFDKNNFIPVYDMKEKDKNGKPKLKYNCYNITIKTEEQIEFSDESNSDPKSEFIGKMFYPDFQFKKGDFITIKKPEWKQDKKGKKIIDEYFRITLTKPDPEDWNYRYQTLNKTLTEWCETKNTVGSYFYQNFYINRNIDRIRANVVNRDWYEDEFNKIFDLQFEKHREHFSKFNIEEIVAMAFRDANILNEVKKKVGLKEQLRYLIKDKIIYYQRPWQQSKNKRGCRFEKVKVKKVRTNTETKQKETYEAYEPRPVIPRSHPLHQEFKIWQQINNVRLWYDNGKEKKELMANRQNAALCIERFGKSSSEIRKSLYKELEKCKTKSWRTFVNETLNLNIKVDENLNNGFSVNFIKRTRKGKEQDNLLKGNTTKIALKNILRFDDKWFNVLHQEINRKREEAVKDEKKKDSCKEPITNLQLLWELIYDITESNPQKVALNIKKHFPDFQDEICRQLSGIKFDDSGLGNLSARAIRQLLPLMKDGWDTNDISSKVSKKINSLINLNNSEEELRKLDGEKLEMLKDFIPDKNTRKQLATFSKPEHFKGLNYWEAAAVVYGSHSKNKVNTAQELQPVPRYSMNNPVVEKIVNETLKLVNAIKARYGFDEVRIELSRELKSSMEEREQIWEAMNENVAKTERAKAMLRELKNDQQHSNSDLETSKGNLDKIKIIEDVVKFKIGKEYEQKTKEFKLSDPKSIKKYLHWLEQHFCCPYTNQPIPLTDVFSGYKVVEIEHIIPKERYFDNSYSNKVITWKKVNNFKGNRTAYEFIVSQRSHNDEIELDSKRRVNLVSADKWEEHVKSMFPKGRKQANLLRKEIPEDPINRQLKETQYINKKLKEELGKLVGPDKVWTTTGAITDTLRDSWKLNEIMKELIRERFEKFKLVTGKKTYEIKPLNFLANQLDTNTGEIRQVEVFPGYSKRLDHRHHALDAIIIACTKQFHIQYLNTLNAIYTADKNNEEDIKRKYNILKTDICSGSGTTRFKTPWTENKFVFSVKESLEKLIVSHKNTNLLISPSKQRNHKINSSKKLASVRGELHKETYYAKRNYIEHGARLEIPKLIKKILELKMDNQNQTMVLERQFEHLVKQTVFKERYQNLLIPLFVKYENEKITKTNIEQLTNNILEEIKNNKLLFDEKTNTSFEWLTVFSDKNTSVRPIGLSMNLNSEKEVKEIADPRIRRLANYRLKYIKQKKDEIDALQLEDKEQANRKSQIDSTPLYSNAIYEVRIKKGENEYEWIELKDLTPELFNKIEYAKAKTTHQIKGLLEKYIEKHSGSYSLAFTDYFANPSPLITSATLIPLKKARQLHWFQDLYEIAPRKYVYSKDAFITYIFEKSKEKRKNKDIPEREIKILKFIDAVRILDFEKPSKILYKNLWVHENSMDFTLAFTLSKNDLVYIPDKPLTEEEISELDFSGKELSKHLYIVKDMNPSENCVVFQKQTTADSISVPETDAREIFNNPNLKDQTEEIKRGTKDMWMQCIKLFTDKLGKKVVPYWKFPNGCWDKEIAERLGLI